MFCDANGEGWLGVFVCVDGRWFWTSSIAGEERLASFRQRGDNQIMGLELLSISLGLGTFKDMLANRRVVVHSDNRGAEASCAVFACVRLCISACVLWDRRVRIPKRAPFRIRGPWRHKEGARG